MRSPVQAARQDEPSTVDPDDDGPDAPVCPDRELVALAQVDRVAFAALYRRYVNPVHRYCYRRLGNRTAAEDATSQVIARAMTSLPAYREQAGGSFRGWLFTIAFRVVTDALRAHRPALSLDLASEVAALGPSPEELVLAGEVNDAVRDLLRRLPPAEQRVLELRLAGLTGAEIAAVLGRSRNAVDVAQSRALARLRTMLTQAPAEEGNQRGRR